ncbi:unnamed protein product, partial [marine sediment metagenome]
TANVKLRQTGVHDSPTGMSRMAFCRWHGFKASLR